MKMYILGKIKKIHVCAMTIGRLYSYRTFIEITVQSKVERVKLLQCAPTTGQIEKAQLAPKLEISVFQNVV